MARSVQVEKIEVDMFGRLSMRIRKVSSDGDLLDYHRVEIPPGIPIEPTIEQVNVHLTEMGFGTLSKKDMNKFKAVTDLQRSMYPEIEENAKEEMRKAAEQDQKDRERMQKLLKEKQGK